MKILLQVEADSKVYSNAWDDLHHFLTKCTQIILEHIDQSDSDFTVEKLSQEMGMSHSALYKRLKAVAGVSVNAFIRTIRLQKAAEILSKGSFNINEIAYTTGFNDVKYFREEFKKVYHLTPSDFKRQQYELSAVFPASHSDSSLSPIRISSVENLSRVASA